MPLRPLRPSGSDPKAPRLSPEKGKLHMFRPPQRVFVFLVVALTLLGSLAPVAAQEATPAATPAGPPEGVEIRSLASGSMEILAPGTAALGFGRVTLAPGAILPFDPNDPSAALIYIASGTATFRIESPISVARSAKSGTPVPTEPEEIAA